MPERAHVQAVGGPGLVWLASYPKSGNTWVRVLLSNLLRDSGEPARINDLEVSIHAGSRDVFESLTGLESSELTTEEALDLRPVAWEALGQRADRTVYAKIHDAYGTTPCGRPNVPAAVTRGAVYIVRNPLDLAVSYAHHRQRSIDETIERMTDPSHRIGGGGRRQLPQHVGGWSAHVDGWIGVTAFPVHVVRYEDLSARPFPTFAGIAGFLGLEAGEDRLRRALDFSSFDALRRQETEAGFIERTADGPFFRSGRCGEWREALDADQVACLLAAHAPTMTRLGYLDAAGRPV